MSTAAIRELLVLEELFLDQLEFKLGAILQLHTLQSEHKQEMLSYIEELRQRTHDNITLIKKSL